MDKNRIRQTISILLAVIFLLIVAAGSVSAGKVVVYHDINFGGAQFTATSNIPYVGDSWNDQISSIKVLSGNWRFYQDANYKGPFWDLEPGDYNWVEDEGIPNDVISSFRQVSEPKVLLYNDIDFGGGHFGVSKATPYVGDYWNDRVSSIKVLSGTWRFYQDANYGGRYWDLGPGDYNWVEDEGIPNDVISSLKPI